MKTLTLSLFLAFILSASVLQTSQQTVVTTGSKTVTINVSPAVQCWRLIHDGKKVIALFESNGVTRTVNTLFCATTPEEIQAEIARLKLAPLPAPKAATAPAGSRQGDRPLLLGPPR